MDAEREAVLRRGLADTTRRVLAGDDSPLARVAATRVLAAAAARDFAAAVAGARQAGLAWEAVAAAAPGFASAYGPGAAEALFDHVATFGSGRRPYVGWRCGDCGWLVLDRGPGGGHPDDAEPGHDPGCARRRALVGAHLERLERDTEPAQPPPPARPGRPAPGPEGGGLGR